MFGGFGIGKLFSIGMIVKQAYSLGTAGGAPFSVPAMIANAQTMPTSQKLMTGFMVLRLLGMSPI